MMGTQRVVWFSLVVVTKNVIGKNKAANYVKLIENVFKAFLNFKFKIAIKVNFPFNHMNKFFEFFFG